MNPEDFASSAVAAATAIFQALDVEPPKFSESSRSRLKSLADRLIVLASLARNNDPDAIEEIFYLLGCPPTLSVSLAEAIRTKKRERRRAAVEHKLLKLKGGDNDGTPRP